jgi:hypothetical protein
MGTRHRARQPSSVEAHWIPMFWNIWREKRGKLAATMERQKVLAAIAEAALDGIVRRVVFSRYFGNTAGILTT